MSSTEEKGRIATESLLHFGVKGMHWGVRKSPEQKAQRKAAKDAKKVARGDKAFEKQTHSVASFVEVHNKANHLYNDHDVARINSKIKYKNESMLFDSPIRRQYYKEHEDAYLARVEQVAKDLGTNPSGTREVHVVRDPKSFSGFVLTTKEVEHADNEIRIPIIFDEKGFIVKVGDPIVHSDRASQIIENFLSHYGVKGMHWGVRRDKSAQAVVVTQKRPGGKLKAKGGKYQPAAEEAVRTVVSGQKARKSGYRALTNAELQAYNTRLNLEAQAERLTYGQKNAGQKFIAQLLGQTGKHAAQQAANEIASKQVKKLLIKGAVTAAAAAV